VDSLTDELDLADYLALTFLVVRVGGLRLEGGRLGLKRGLLARKV
jgi:hypothetical protein